MSSQHSQAGWQLFESELSPFCLKAALMLRYAGLPYQRVPMQSNFRETLAAARRHSAVRAGKLPVHWPPMKANDELPLLPFLFATPGSGRFPQPPHNIYDSTAMADWLAKHSPRADQFPELTPSDDRAADFVIRLIDDYADEFGLYMMHHNRWVTAAYDNNAGARLGEEWQPVIPLGMARRAYGRHFAARQVRRLPYLFSVAPESADYGELPPALRPPALVDFPPTHELLDAAFLRFLAAVESIFSQRDFLFGYRLSLADAAIFGQLAANIDDPAVERVIAEQAPKTHQWLQKYRAGTPTESYAHFELHDGLKPLLAEICRTHVPLMQQNLKAYEAAGFASAAECNEQAFTANAAGGPAMYNGALPDGPYRAVVKSFQVETWRQCRRRWERLNAAEREQIAALLPENHGLSFDH